MWVPGRDLRLSDLDSKHLSWLNHLAGPCLSPYSCDGRDGCSESDRFHSSSCKLGRIFDKWRQEWRYSRGGVFPLGLWSSLCIFFLVKILPLGTLLAVVQLWSNKQPVLVNTFLGPDQF